MARPRGPTVITLPPLGAGGKPMRDAAEEMAAAARAISGRWSRRIPGTVRVSVSPDGKSATVTAGGHAAPMAYTFEGRSGGRPIAHPVYGHGARSTWTWVNQTPRPFMVQAADAAVDRAAQVWGDQIIGAWTRSAGFR